MHRPATALGDHLKTGQCESVQSCIAVSAVQSAMVRYMSQTYSALTLRLGSAVIFCYDGRHGPHIAPRDLARDNKPAHCGSGQRAVAVIGARSLRGGLDQAQ
jgi:hypothetical protein